MIQLPPTFKSRDIYYVDDRQFLDVLCTFVHYFLLHEHVQREFRVATHMVFDDEVKLSTYCINLI